MKLHKICEISKHFLEFAKRQSEIKLKYFSIVFD